ncbi:E3 ubiquitin-protein ligase TM129 [Lingula anatina]|uniref:E3 ubiquitin-protein ligase TM129 n=1 Tax=Lingula anatina TaxID=7574 RepID=A0A1S3IYV6_LINAN|nr:E3 ubiquitin-protein ligase TM129 [Lingula anatina]|eukprot:XP_013403390.1 E3 ubiquitin-protein ligase TM129 [Lingula anatina]
MSTVVYGPEYWLVTLVYWMLAACFVAPPSEFVHGGLTVQNLLSSYLGSEEMNFIYYHIRRTTATAIIHSFIPLGYYFIIGFAIQDLHLYHLHRASFYWKIYLAASLIIPFCVCLLAYFWSLKKWNNHPIAKNLGYLGNGDSWRAVASSIDVEFRRINKFTSGVPGRRLYVTDSWIIQTAAYHLNVAHQRDMHLTLSGAEEHEISPESFQGVQFLNITVDSINEHVQSFVIRLNSLEYGDLKEKLQAPVRNAREIVIHQSLGDRFLLAFKEQIDKNARFNVAQDVELDSCIGCMLVPANTKLQKLCDQPEEGECKQCYCRPLWCIDCMGKWFASRQDQQKPELWLSGKAPCPMCRATFCVLDVSRIG